MGCFVDTNSHTIAMCQVRVFSLLLWFLLAVGNASAQTYRLDSTFANNGINRRNWGNDAGVYAQRILKHPDGSYSICGYEYVISENAFYNNIWKLDACGKTDSSFGVNGLMRHTFEQRNSGYDYALQTDGKYVVTGSQAPSNAGSQQKTFIARYHANGKPDSSFAGTGSRKFAELGPGGFGSLIPFSGGRFLATSGQTFVRVKSNGDYDSTFGSNGVFNFPTPPGVNFSYEGSGLLRQDGTIWTVVGSWPGGDVRLSVYAIDTTGKIDSTFGTNGFFIEGTAAVGGGNPFKSILQSNGKLVVACTQADQGVRLVRIMRPGKVDSTFGNNGFVFVPGSRLSSIFLLSGDRILVSQNNTPSPGSVFTLLDSSGVAVPGFTINNGANNIAVVGNGTEFLTSLLEEPNGEWTLAGGTREFQVVRVLPAARSGMPNIKRTGNVLDAQVNLPNAAFQWYLNGSLIAGATAETLNVSAVGTYKVVATSSRGCLGEDVFVVTTVVGVESDVEEAPFQLYPNPVREMLYFGTPNEAGGKLQIRDMQGRSMIQEVLPAHSDRILVQGLPSGLYMLEWISADKVVRQTFIKE